MAASTISHLKYDIDNYSLSLHRVANLASSFFIKDSIVRMAYLKEVDDYIRDANFKFKNTLNPNEKIRIINEIKSEYDITEKEYQILRQGDYTKYLITDIFEDQGALKYAKITAGVVAGGVQAISGITMAYTAKKLNMTGVSSIGIVLASHGGNNIFESISPILFENQSVGPIRFIYREFAKALGYDKFDADFAYSAVDFSVTAYSAYKGLVLQQNPNRLIPKGWFEKPGTGRLFRHIPKDYTTRWKTKTTPLRIFQVGNSLYKFKATFVDDGYIYHDGLYED
ncbi:DUF4225 domain-containing protein [Pectobacterium aroidearum]|uniref:DUF4225 domain-containing protein n=1 Tax=Pectobacterium aroidearum TaxID=1201031 RepID=UPI0015E0231D|nr:DUF4225 domain-containing protein [Pectobacterium aroidearum]MBA0206372.1 DUF4225 domain-containing protein [Pectobacterium aroidearum]